MSAQQKPVVVFLEGNRERRTLVTWLLEEIATVSTDIGSLALATSGNVVLVDLAGDIERAMKTIEQVRASAPHVSVVALAESKDPVIILRAMRAGAREFGVPDEGGEIVDIVKSLLKRAAADRPAGTVIAVFPAKGGIGSTTLATNLAGALCAGNKLVLLIDCDKQLGNVLTFLDMAPRYTTVDVAKNLHRLDRDLLFSSLGRHESGVFVLTHPDSLEDHDSVNGPQMAEILQFAARHFDYVVCDGLHGFDEFSLAVLDASTRIELMLTQDVVALKNAKRCLDIFYRLKYDEGKVALVVNRFHKKSTIDLAAINENLGYPVASTLANDHPSAVAALNRGVLLSSAAPKSELTTDIDALAARLSGAPVARRKPRGAFAALFGGRDDAPPPPRRASSKSMKVVRVSMKPSVPSPPVTPGGDTKKPTSSRPPGKSSGAAPKGR